MLRDAGAGGRPCVGLRRHPFARACGLLRARRIRHGHVPDAPDRRARRLRQCQPARLHGVPGLARTAVVLARLRMVRLRRADGRAGTRTAGAGVRLAGVPLARHRRVSLDHHAGADLRAASGVLPQRHGLWRQQRHDRLQGPARLSRAGGGHALRAAGDHRAVPLRAVPDRPLSGNLPIRQGADRRARHGVAHPVPRLPAGILQARRLGAVGGDGRHRRRAVRAAGRHHQSVGVLACQLHRGGDLGGGRRTRHAVGRDPRCGAGQSRQDLFHQRPAVALALRAWVRCSSSSPCSCRAASWAWSAGAGRPTCPSRHRRRPRRARSPDERDGHRARRYAALSGWRHRQLSTDSVR